MKNSSLARTKVGCWLRFGSIFLFSLAPILAHGVESNEQVVDHSKKVESPSGTAPAIGDSHKTEDKQVADGQFYEQFIHGKLQIGTRMVYRSLTNADSGHQGGTYGSGTYLGTIYAMDEEQSYLPNKFFITYYFTKYFGFELAYDSMEAKTVAWDIYNDVNKTDGNASLSGPTVTLLGKFANSTPFSPYIGIGLGFFKGDFDEDSAWAHDDTSLGSRDREMVVESITAVLLTSGLTWSFATNWLLDLSLQYVKADPDVMFNGYTNGRLDTEQPGHFPMDNVAFRLGIVYSF
jgi:outer membrane protein W